MIVYKDKVVLFSLFFFPLLALLFGNINVGGVNLQFFFTLISFFIALLCIFKWAKFELKFFYIFLLGFLFVLSPLFIGKFGAIQVIYIMSPFMYFLVGSFCKFDNDFINNNKHLDMFFLKIIILIIFLNLFLDFGQITSRPVSIFLALYSLFTLIVLDNIKAKVLCGVLILFILFLGARGALLAGIIAYIGGYFFSKINLKWSFVLYISLSLFLVFFHKKLLSIIFSIDTLRERTFFDGIYSYEKIKNIDFNTSGRDVAWPLYWDYIVERSNNLFRLIFGDGPGAASKFGGEVLGEKWHHPHNEFIRLMFDYGILGLFLFVFFWLYVTYYVVSNASAFIVRLYISLLIFTLLISMTDNPLMYPLYYGNILLFFVGYCYSNSKNRFLGVK